MDVESVFPWNPLFVHAFELRGVFSIQVVSYHRPFLPLSFLSPSHACALSSLCPFPPASLPHSILFSLTPFFLYSFSPFFNDSVTT